MENKKQTNGEKRLSPRARMLLEDTRRKFSHCPRKAIRYLRSVKPEELTMYDRQKIGREILARAPYTRDALNSGVDNKFIRETYDLPAVDKKGEWIRPIEGKKRLMVHQNARRFEREMIFWMKDAFKKSQMAFYDDGDIESDVTSCFRGAVNAYEYIGMRDKVIECYNRRIAYINERLASGRYNWHLPRSAESYEQEKAAFIKKHQCKGLEKAM